MPYEIKEHEGEYCVFKKGEDTPIKGGCHATEEECKKHMAALNMAMQEEKSIEPFIKGDEIFVSIDETKAVDYMELVRGLETSFYSRNYGKDHVDMVGVNPYINAVFDDSIIVTMPNGSYRRVEYTATDESFSFAPENEWKVVEKNWVVKTLIDAVKETAREDMVVTFGSEVKALDDKGSVGGILVPFTDENNPDLDGDFFNKDTDFDVQDGDFVTVYYNHGFDATLKRRKLGGGRGRVEIRDVGVWVEAQLDLRDEYEKAIFNLVQKGKLGWSSGSLPNLVEREPVGKAYWVKSWPLGKDASLTPTPAAGVGRTQAYALKQIKSLVPSFDSLIKSEILEDEDQNDLESDEIEEEVVFETVQNNSLEDNMTIVLSRADREQLLKDLKNEVVKEWKVTPVTEGESGGGETINDRIEKVLKFIEDEPKLRRAGYVTDAGGSNDPHVKSFGDFLLAVKRGDRKRLTTIYKSRRAEEFDSEDPEVKDLMEDSGGSGGYLVPDEYMTSLLKIAETNNGVVSRVQSIPVNKVSGYWPSLDQFVAPTAGAGNTAYAAGVTAAITAEGGALTETEPGFEMISWRVHKIGGYTQVSNELIADSAVTIEALLTSLFGVAIGAKTEYYILRGTGVGQPLGILNSPALINVTPDTNNLFSFIDAVTMQSRFKSVGGTPVWLMHPSVWPDIMTMEIGTAGANAWVANMQATAGNTLNGYPFVQSEHLPQANNSGDVMLVDLNAYLLFRRSGLAIAFSEHVGFLNDLGTWRFTQRQDGQPWLKNAITLADPQGSYTMSPFVNHND